MALIVFALPVAIVLWAVARLFGRRTMVILGAGLIGLLGYFSISAHFACANPDNCDGPGMMLFAPIIYIVVPLMIAVTVVLLRRIWLDLSPP
ncbi:hypothetical protein PSQ90_12495 [Devosia rhodophyticola]|uniref:Disulfide bond formation protein B n=1 Tax=Devosia rhodophyticola TaxID=3026423 RepID=A0ABY7YUS0_9HYPH|nr:hypothetical protein [Devosia rhodophyticola]WDR05105.1 hypothetical protein PSQ90_12495 [Devosia rhodophyticola]